MRLEDCISRWLGLKAHRVRKVIEQDGQLIAEMETFSSRSPRCGNCGHKVHRTKGCTQRKLWRDLKIRKLPLVLAYTPRRVVCPDCGVRVEQIPWAQKWSRVTRSLARAAAELARQTDLSTVARHYDIGWKTVSHIIHQVVRVGLSQRRKRPLHVIGVDEVSRKKGHKYLTQAVQLLYV